MAARKERQNRARNDRIAGERLHIVFVELFEEAVQLGLQREQKRDNRRARDRKRRLAETGDETESDGGQRRDRASSHRALRLMPGTVGIADRRAWRRIRQRARRRRNGWPRLAGQPCQPRDKSDERERAHARHARPGAQCCAGRTRVRCRSAGRRRARSQRTVPANTSRRSGRRHRSRSTGRDRLRGLVAGASASRQAATASPCATTR